MRKTFTLIEILVVLSIIGILAAIALSASHNARNKANDARRISDIHTAQAAITQYYSATGHFPVSDADGCGGWDTPNNNKTFISVLIPNYLQPMGDPVAEVTSNDPACGNNLYIGNYAYALYTANNASSYTCTPVKPFYVILIRKLDGSTGVYSGSPGFDCPNRIPHWQSPAAPNPWTGVYVDGSYEYNTPSP